MFGTDGYNCVKNRLDYFNMGEFAPMAKWMNMPEIGMLIASHFNVMLVSFIDKVIIDVC